LNVSKVCAKITEGLILWYPFEDNLEDNSGNENHGTMHIQPHLQMD